MFPVFCPGSLRCVRSFAYWGSVRQKSPGNGLTRPWGQAKTWSPVALHIQSVLDNRATCGAAGRGAGVAVWRVAGSACSSLLVVYLQYRQRGGRRPTVNPVCVCVVTAALHLCVYLWLHIICILRRFLLLLRWWKVFCGASPEQLMWSTLCFTTSELNPSLQSCSHRVAHFLKAKSISEHANTVS